MKQQIAFLLSLMEKEFLVDLVRLSIVNRFAAREGQPEVPVPVPSSEMLQRELGAFVTLKIDGKLRGCIGYLVGDGPLYLTVVRMAQAAAFEDPRFSPLEYEEVALLEVEISVMGPISPCGDLERIEVGRHGLIVRKGMHSGLLLPQVPVEWGWNRETFLEQTCRKAGLPEMAWREPQTQVLWFEAVVFGDKDIVAENSSAV